MVLLTQVPLRTDRPFAPTIVYACRVLRCLLLLPPLAIAGERAFFRRSAAPPSAASALLLPPKLTALSLRSTPFVASRSSACRQYRHIARRRGNTRFAAAVVGHFTSWWYHNAHCRSGRFAGKMSTSGSQWGDESGDSSPRKTNSVDHPKQGYSMEREARMALRLMNLASAHAVPAALRAFVRLGVPDVLGGDGTGGGATSMSVDEIASSIEEAHTDAEVEAKVNRGALLRILRLLVSVGVLSEEFSTSASTKTTGGEWGGEEERRFGLTPMGALLRTKESMGQPRSVSLASCVEHWTEAPLWDSWLELPAYVIGAPSAEGRSTNSSSVLPFNRANVGVSSDDYYGTDNPESLRYANDFVRGVSDREIEAILSGFDWGGRLSGKTVVDVGGYHGAVMGEVAKRFPNVRCVCMDLPRVIASAPDPLPHPGVELVGGDAFDPSTIPPCDAILMKHFLDPCMWDEEQSLRILRSCHVTLPSDGKVILGEAVLPDDAASAIDDDGDKMALVMDALFVLVGRDGQRTESAWRKVAAKADFVVESISPTSSPSCYIIVLAKNPSLWEGT